MLLTSAVLMLALGVTGLIADRAEARPKYLAVFMEAYPALKEQVSQVKCQLCHPVQDKKIRTEYATLVGKGLPAKNVAANVVIQKALQAAEAEKDVNGVTYGDLIKAGKLPN